METISVKIYLKKMKWDSFDSHLLASQKDLYFTKQFSDVTLVSDDIVQIKAHKTVLSSTSSIFKQLLMINATSNPILYLKGVKYTELEAIIQFIYTGEAQVYENRIDFFLDASKDLTIKELNKAEPAGESEITDKKYCSDEFNNDSKLESENNIEANSEVQLNDSSMNNLSVINSTKLQSSVCPSCDATFACAGNMRKHYKRNHSESPPQFVCNKCSKVFNQKSNLDRHVKICLGQTIH